MLWAEQFNNRPLGLMEMGQGSGGLAKAGDGYRFGDVRGGGLCVGAGGVPHWAWRHTEADKAPRVPEWAHTVWGAYMTPWYALWAQRYMHEFGATSEQLAEVAVAARGHAVLNPDSIMGKRGPIDVEDVVTSRMIASPLHLLECAQDNDGGYAMVITSAERAKSLKKEPVYILGGAEATYIDPYVNIDKPWFPAQGKAVSALRIGPSGWRG